MPTLRPSSHRRLLLCAAALLAVGACVDPRATRERRVGERLERLGEEIVVAGQFFHVGAPVVLWLDAEGYDAYRPWPHFASPHATAPGEAEEPQRARYGARRLAPGGGAQDEEAARRARNGQWSLAELAEVVDQFVVHYDACGTSELCYRVLHDERNLSIHFMIDLDGTIHQTLDLDERAFHATIANDRSIGVELAQVGAVPAADLALLDEWYEAEGEHTRVTLPERFGDGGQRVQPFEAFTARRGPFVGPVHGVEYAQYDFTEAQYESLARLAAALHSALPRIRLDVPRGPDGAVLTRVLAPDEFAEHSGILGHFHVQANKQDPGPAFDWERLVRDARAHLAGPAR
jgi:N-acetyl-anhydromuramyl-L-alanine amidase AmpD